MTQHKSPLPEEFAAIEAAQEFWDTHSTADYWEEMEDVEMQLSPSLRAKTRDEKIVSIAWPFSHNPGLWL